MGEFSGLPTSIETLVVIAQVLSPGYVFTQIARRSIAHIEEPTDLRFLLTIITAGVGIQALAFPIYTRFLFSYYIGDTILDHQMESFIWLVIVCFLAPFALGALAGRAITWDWVEKLLDKIGLGYVDRMPSAWDYAMLQEQPRFVRIHLTDGNGMVGGVWKSNSLASSDPERADLYLEQAWQLTESGDFVQALSGSCGVWVSQQSMSYVYFYEGEERPDGHLTDSTVDPDSAGSDSPNREKRDSAKGTTQAIPTTPDAPDRARRKER